jgi:L-ascorbate metabolism protein UlaG (beta-lactamase superfamily)
MRKLAIVLAAALLVAGPACAQGKKIVVRWFGQSYFQIVSTAGTRIVIDPHAIMSYPRAVVPADLVLITHPHQDHNQIDMIENKERAKVLVGVKGDARKQEWNLVDEKFKDVTVRSVPLYHDKSRGLERGKNSAFVVDIDGLHFVHLGDLGHELTESQLKAIGPVDVLFIPVGGTYTINGGDAKKVVEQLKPKRYIFPMHYGTKDFDELVGPEEFLDEQQNIQRVKTNEVQIDLDTKPEQPIIVIMGWKKPE